MITKSNFVLNLEFNSLKLEIYKDVLEGLEILILFALKNEQVKKKVQAIWIKKETVIQNNSR